MASRNNATSFNLRRLWQSFLRLTSQHQRLTLLAALIVATVGAAGMFAFSPLTPKAHAQGGTGAMVPWVELEAHSATTNGAILGPDVRLGQLAADGVDRQVVQLTGQGQYVQFTVPQQANSINVRYSIPDAAGGGGISSSIAVYVNGVKQSQDLQLTSKYTWLYGTPDFSNPNQTWSDSPGGTPHHMFDEAHMLLPQMAQGATVKLQVDSENTAQWYAIDVADFQEVSPLSEPAGAISVTDSPYNADPTGATDATSAIQAAVNAGESQGKVVWIPQGKFLVTSHIIVNNVTFTGAGPWYSVLEGGPVNGNNQGAGVFGNPASSGGSSNVTLSNFAIQGQIINRCDNCQENGVGGALNNSTISNLWIEHEKVGMWFDGPFTGLTITGVRIDTTTADGINFHQGITNSKVTQSFLRSTGDDGLAMWSDTGNGAPGDTSDTFDSDTVESNYVANGIAIYGGISNSVTNNYVSGSQYRGGGIMLDYENFGNPTAPFSGTTTVSNNTINHGGGFGDQGIQEFGALMFWADNGAINAPFTVSGDEIDNSTFGAIQFDGGNPFATATLSNINVNGATSVFVDKVNSVTGSATNVTASNITVGSLESCESVGSFNLTLGSGNSGWSDTTQFCGDPTPTPYGAATATPTFPPGPTATATQPPTPVPTATQVPGTDVVDINAGGSASSPYVTDADYSTGNTYSDTSSGITMSGLDSNPAPQAVYQTCRWAPSFSYTIPGLTAGQSYTVILHWAELTWTAAGQRTFNVSINGSQVLTNFDVYAAAGYKTAVSRAFATTANGSGQIVIAFSQGGADNPFISGIQIRTNSGGSPTPTPTVAPSPTATTAPNPTPTSTTAPTPTTAPTVTPTPTSTPSPSGLVTAINAGSSSAAGNYVADTDYNTGNMFSDTSTSISTSGGQDIDPGPQGMYQTARWASGFTYTIPGLTAGKTYDVVLHWAELSFQASGQRKFNVAINGATVLSSFDVYATVGYKTAVSRSFIAQANGSGQIVIAFSQGGADNPFINGIEIYNTAQDVAMVNAGGSAAGGYTADGYFNTGSTYSDTSTPINTSNNDQRLAPQSVYQTCRWAASFTYTIPNLTAGQTYTVTLHWAELTWQQPGQRAFNVAINGSQVLNNFDVYAAGGYKTAISRSYTATANSSGQIVISFTQGTADNPFISGIEISH